MFPKVQHCGNCCSWWTFCQVLGRKSWNSKSVFVCPLQQQRTEGDHLYIIFGYKSFFVFQMFIMEELRSLGQMYQLSTYEKVLGIWLGLIRIIVNMQNNFWQLNCRWCQFIYIQICFPLKMAWWHKPDCWKGGFWRNTLSPK